MTKTIDFADKTVTYDTFVSDIANSVVHLLSKHATDPEYISQRRAYSIFGRGNVDRWRKQGDIQPHKRVGKVEYRTADLRKLQSRQQDYKIKNKKL